jgi:alpha-beta hydrolase superfamily lysophospholipase
MKILFLDGLGSNPTGKKPALLREHGFEVAYPILPEWDFDGAVRTAQNALDADRPDVIVGYSRGGAVAMNLASGDVPLVLLAPAWKVRGTATTVKPRRLILHSSEDVLVPIDDSRELMRNSGLPDKALRVVGEEHDMDDPESLQAMLEAVESFRD